MQARDTGTEQNGQHTATHRNESIEIMETALIKKINKK